MGTYFLTGATSGIGRATAQLLHGRDDDLVLLARNADRARGLADDFPGADVVEADLSDTDVGGELELPESLDGVVHAAGVVDVASVEDTAPDSLVETVTVNLIAPMLWTRVLQGAVRRARGTHVFVNSGSGLQAKAGWASYNASKFGLRGFADALRQEESEHGVRVSSVYPGRTATAMQERVHAQEGREYDAGAWTRPETVAEVIVRLFDLGDDATIPDVVLRPR